MKYRPGIDPSRLVFIDETWTKTNMAPLRGWAPRGQRLLGQAPFGHWNTMTFIAALRHDRIEAPWLLNGPVNGERFRVYVEKVLVPTLLPEDIVVMDNLGSHKSKAVRQAIRDAGARLLLLPKYSPDLNPIEQFFASRSTPRQVRKPCSGWGRLARMAMTSASVWGPMAAPQRRNRSGVHSA